MLHQEIQQPERSLVRKPVYENRERRERVLSLFTRPLLTGVGLLAMLAGSGCNDNPAGAPPAAGGSKPAAPATAAPANPGAPATAKAGDKPKQEKPKPKIDAAKLLETAARRIEGGELEEAQQVLAQLRKAQSELSKTEKERLTELENDREEKRRLLAAEKRAAELVRARELLDQGQLEAATQAIDNVNRAFPTPEERKATRDLKSTIEEHRRRRREFGIAMKLLGSAKKEEVRSARSRLAQDPEVAIPLLVETTQGDDETLARNALETLRLLNDPARTLPALMAVLSSETRTSLWPVAVTEIQKAGAPGAGLPLLKLALSAKSEPQRLAALSALSAVVDPPSQTLVELLPLIYQDGPALAPALAAVQHAIVIHQQFDLLARRGVEVDLTSEQEQQLDGLAARLSALAEDSAKQEASLAAQTLGVLTRLVVPKPLTDVKVLRATAELPESPASAVLDGVWNSIEPGTMWRHPVEKDRKVTLVLDLGTERTVSGIRIWNENEAGGRHRGWKEVDVFISDTPASLKSVARGVVPQAPGVADAPDYGCLLSVPCVRGRYIRLECPSQWQPDGIGGISEIQVLGF